MLAWLIWLLSDLPTDIALIGGGLFLALAVGLVRRASRTMFYSPALGRWGTSRECREAERQQLELGTRSAFHPDQLEAWQKIARARADGEIIDLKAQRQKEKATA